MKIIYTENPLESLKTPYDMTPQEGKDKSWWKPNPPRWNKEREHAIEWLTQYQLLIGKEVEL